jgi:hypothetical protein
MVDLLVIVCSLGNLFLFVGKDRESGIFRAASTQQFSLLAECEPAGDPVPVRHYHIWILGGASPASIREEGQLYEGGPIWRIEQISPEFAH